MKEVEISIKGLIFYILKHWISILVGMFVCAMALCGIKYYKDSQINDDAEAYYDETDAESDLSDQEKSYLDSLYVYVESLRNANDERENSLIMRIDPSNAIREDVSFLILVDDPSEIEGIKQAYEQALNGVALRNYLSQETGISVFDINETVYASVYFSNTVSSSASITVKILSDNRENSEKIATAVNSFLSEQNSKLVEKGCEHELIVNGKDIYQGSDADVLARQTQFSNEIQSRKWSILDIEAGLDDDAYAYYSFISGNENEDDHSDYSDQIHKSGTIRFSMKYLLLGLLVGMFFVCGLYFVIYVLANRIDEDDDTEKAYGMSFLGIIPGKDYGKILYRLRNIGRRTFDFDESIGLIAARIGAISRKENITRIGIIGCGIKKNSEKAANDLSASLKKLGIEAVIIDDPLYNPNSVEQLRTVEHVVLLEKVGITHRTEIWNEKEMADKLEIKLDGIIMAG